jgi:NADP-dependent 3-hydroxy acid dehydrogenase YdfG
MSKPSISTSRDLSGRVAVITGAASGIGLALARIAADKGMKVALADINPKTLEEALAIVKGAGGEGIIVRTDVTQRADLEELRRQTVQQLGTPWLVANNAGITKLALTWKHTEADWKRMFDINVGGVINGLLAFLPGLMQQDDGSIVNTASVAGLLTVPGSAAYVASKHAVVGLSETLYWDLEAAGSNVGISVLCPGLVKTNIFKSLEGGGSSSHTSPEMTSAHALEPMDVATQVFNANAKRQFWILTHAAQMAPFLKMRLEQALSQANPDSGSIDPDAAKTAGLAVGVDYLKLAGQKAKA